MRDFAMLLLQDDCPCPVKLLSCDEFEVTETTEAISFAGARVRSSVPLTLELCHLLSTRLAWPCLLCAGNPVRSSVLTLLAGILKLNERVLSLDLSGVGLDVQGAMKKERGPGLR